MSNDSQHVVRSAQGGWSVKKEGSTRATKTFETQEEAIVYARQVAKNQKGELYVHSGDGKIREKESYRSTPRQSKGG